MITFLTSSATEITQQMQATIIEWNEIVYLTIGAAIGLIASLATTVIQRALDRNGKVNIFYKFISPKSSSHDGWGFRDSGDGNIYFSIPVAYEIQNTSNVARVIRDVNLLLFKDNCLVGSMVQINKMISKSTTGGISQESEYYYGSENGSYSFVLAPSSIQKQECHYTIKCPFHDKENKFFNQVVLRYYDEKNKAHYFVVKDICGNWNEKIFEPDTEWILLNKKKKCPK